MGFIDVNNVSLTLPDGRPLLDEVSFRVGEGSVSALIGANGAGKSTLLKIIRGEVKADAGAITLDGGLRVMDQSRRARHRIRRRAIRIARRDPQQGAYGGGRASGA